MGMDLIVAVAVREHPERTTKDLLVKLDELTVERAKEIFEEVEGFSYEEFYPDPDAETLTVVEIVKGWILEFIGAMDGWDRSILIMQHPKLDKVIAIGGGDSWGETPDGLYAVAATAEWGEW